MTAEQIQSLRDRLEAFPLDQPESPGAFAAKLARENEWSLVFANRAIGEYRRYLILAGTAGHAVSPSETIDAVWHQHLLFTRSYWDELCGDVMKFPLHHEPARGSRAEKDKYDDWYAKTFESYRRNFGEEPPADVWPSPSQRLADRSKFVRVDVSRNWVLPKFSVGQWAAVSIVLLLMVALAAGCQRPATPQAASPIAATLVAQGWNPFDFTGKQFLIFYSCAFVAACVAAAMFRRSALASTGAAPLKAEDLDSYDIAYLNGGPRLTVNAAVAHLIAQNQLTFDTQTKMIVASRAEQDRPFLHTLERTLLSQTRVPTTLRALHEGLDPVVGQTRAGLQQRGLIADDNAVRSARAIGLVLLIGVMVVGAIKLLVGVSRDRPVGYLIVLLVASAIVTFAIFARKRDRTRRGAEALAELRGKHQQADAVRAVDSGAMTAAMAMALFGPAILADMPLLGDFRQTIRESRGDAAATSGCGSSTSTGGSSCGSSGGGGDGGGGGCGGCGGGGGD